MNDVTVVTSVTYPSPESLALVADVQYHEPYLSAALNRKFRGIVDPGFYAGFLPKPGGGMNLLITSVDGDKTAGAASVDIGEFYQVTIQHRKDISLALNAGKKYAIVLKGRYLLGEDTYQVNTASHIHAAEFVARTYTDSYQLGDGELLVCTVNIPAGVSTITQEMIDTSERINRTIGIDISDSVTSTRSDVAASSLAVKKAYDLAKSKYTAQDASTTQKGLVQLSSATNSTSEVLAATPKAVKAAYDLANGKYTAQDATTTQKGIVQLSSDTNSTSETLAATPKAVKAAYDLAAGKAPSSHTHPWNQITGVPTASLTAKGITQLSSATNSTSEVLAATPKAVKAAYDLANGKYTAQDATTAQKGIVQLSSATNSTSEVLAATPKAVKAAYDLANGKQAADATLTALAALATAADKLPYFTGVDRAALTALTSVGRAILGKTSIQSVLDYLGLGEGSALPVGVPVPWPLETPPTGWLKCNGAAFSSEMYPKLAKAYPTNKLPDLRGEFIRGWDDGRGVDAGRALLNWQPHTILDHAHYMELWTGDGLAAGSAREGVNPGILATYGDGGIVKTDEPGHKVPSSLRAISSRSVKRYGEISGNVGTETRPRNVAFNYIVRAA
ncbi:phage tail protein [Escherichia coli]|uniref:phage tail protein n=3 Tax=Escherichia coli TaxID=562 RepID=UPI000BB8F4AD|nr:tail fiber protein [Escherichia coli]EFN4790135.1 phage tail protein [Escherichia coli]EHR8946403.1 tail fiber protein [Escherichia coli]HAN8323969.1 phage tail protein [Escherichia coli]HAW5799850.1 phage tail protein [Escherichia coli]